MLMGDVCNQSDAFNAEQVRRRLSPAAFLVSCANRFDSGGVCAMSPALYLAVSFYTFLCCPDHHLWVRASGLCRASTAAHRLQRSCKAAAPEATRVVHSPCRAGVGLLRRAGNPWCLRWLKWRRQRCRSSGRDGAVLDADYPRRRGGTHGSNCTSRVGRLRADEGLGQRRNRRAARAGSQLSEALRVHPNTDQETVQRFGDDAHHACDEHEFGDHDAFRSPQTARPQAAARPWMSIDERRRSYARLRTFSGGGLVLASSAAAMRAPTTSVAARTGSSER